MSNPIQKTELTFKEKQEIFKRMEKSILTVSELRVCSFMPIDKISINSTLLKEFSANGNVLKRQTPYGYIDI